MRELMREPIGIAQRAGMRKHFHFSLHSLTTAATVGGPDAQELLIRIAQEQLVDKVDPSGPGARRRSRLGTVGRWRGASAGATSQELGGCSGSPSLAVNTLVKVAPQRQWECSISSPASDTLSP